MITSGIRVGTPAVTTRGFVETDCIQVVEWIDQIIENIENEAVVAHVKDEVNAFMERFSLYQEVSFA